MKQIFTFLTASFVLVLTLAGCASSKVQGHSVYCNIELNKVKLNGIEVATDIHDMFFSDENIAVSFTRELSSISLELLNKTPQALTMVWDKCAFVNANGEVDGVIHEGVKLVDKGAPLKNTNIPSQSYLNDFAIPQSAPYMSNVYVGWQYKYIYMWTYPSKESAEEAKKRLDNQPTRLILYLSQNNEILEYDFEFLLKSPIYGNDLKVSNVGK